MRRLHRSSTVQPQPHWHAKEHFEDELEAPRVLDPVLERGVISISHEVGTYLAPREFIKRLNHHFRQDDLGYRFVNGDTIRLKVRSRKYPLFGVFAGNIHAYEKLPKASSNYSTYAVEGLLEYRLSFLWFISVASFFFLLVYIFKPGLLWGSLLQAVGTGAVVYATYKMGLGERREVGDRVENSFLRLRTTLHNIR
jgi:hypothetical protein